MREFLVKTVATFFGVGYIPFASGTFGSIAGAGAFLCSWYLLQQSFYMTALEILLAQLGVFFIITAAGIWACREYAKISQKHDAKEIVIDEVAGQWLTYILFYLLLMILGRNFLGLGQFCADNGLAVISPTIGGLMFVLLPLVFFRVFDILKPGIIKKFDDSDEPIAVMLDDLVAAFFAVVFSYAMFIILDCFIQPISF